MLHKQQLRLLVIVRHQLLAELARSLVNKFETLDPTFDYEHLLAV